MSERTERLKGLLQEAAEKGNIGLIGHDNADADSVISCMLAASLCAEWGIPAVVIEPVCPDPQADSFIRQAREEGISFCVETGADMPLVLLDHHATVHAGIPIACIDHHPSEEPVSFPYVQIENAGACGMLVLKLMGESGLVPSGRDLCLAVSALYLDTIALRSTKISEAEKQWARAQAVRLGMDVARLEREGMGLTDLSMDTEKLVSIGRKDYLFGGKKVVSTYLQSERIPETLLARMLEELKGCLIRENASLWVFLHHNPLEGISTEYDLYPDGRMETVRYDRLISRGKDVMPRVERLCTGKEI